MALSFGNDLPQPTRLDATSDQFTALHEFLKGAMDPADAVIAIEMIGDLFNMTSEKAIAKDKLLTARDTAKLQRHVATSLAKAKAQDTADFNKRFPGAASRVRVLG